eukprot:687111-Prorocentrum_minimum.AAC.1
MNTHEHTHTYEHTHARVETQTRVLRSNSLERSRASYLYTYQTTSAPVGRDTGIYDAREGLTGKLIFLVIGWLNKVLSSGRIEPAGYTMKHIRTGETIEYSLVLSTTLYYSLLLSTTIYYSLPGVPLGAHSLGGAK